MNHCPKIKTCLLIWMLSVLLPYQAVAAPPITQPPEALSEAIENMLAIADSNRDTALKTDLIPRMLDFVDAPKRLGESFPLEDRDTKRVPVKQFNDTSTPLSFEGLVL